MSKLSVGSIPSTYESIISNLQNDKVFGTSSPRFKDSEDIVFTANVSIQDHYNEKTPENVSHSTKGYGPLVSQKKR